MSCGVVGASASSITTHASTGSHMLKINGYSSAALVISNGSYATSSEFEAAGHTWCIRYYPNGAGPESAGHISLYLRLILAENITTVSRGGKPPAPYHRQSTAAQFGPKYLGNGFPAFIERSVLEKSEYLVDDCFAIRCDIDVLHTSAVPDPTVEPHDLLRLQLTCTCSDRQCKRVHHGRRRRPSPCLRLFGCCGQI